LEKPKAGFIYLGIGLLFGGKEARVLRLIRRPLIGQGILIPTFLGIRKELGF